MKTLTRWALPGRLPVAVCITAAVLLCAYGAHAAWFDDVRLTVDPDASYTSYNNARCVASDASGNIHVVWTDYRDGLATVYYKRFDGVTWTADEALVATAFTSIDPAIAADGIGNIHVVWTDYRDGYSEIYYKMSDGTLWSSPVRLSTSTANSIYPSVAADHTGMVYVVWQEYRDLNWEIYYRHFNGVVWGSETRLTSNTGISAFPCVAADNVGHVHVVWHDTRPGDYEIYYKKYDGTWQPDERLSFATGTSERPCVAVDDLGMVHVVWADHRSGNPEIYYRKHNGIGWSSEEVLTELSEDPLAPSIAAGTGGSLHLLWHTWPGSVSDIYYRNFDGTAWGPELRLTYAARASEYASCAVDNGGTCHAVWQDSRDGNFEIYWKIIGEPLPKPEVISMEPDSATWNSVVHITDMTGTGFYPDAQVRLQRTGEADLYATDVTVVSDTQITCNFDLTGLPSGDWDVAIMNPDLQGDTLAAGFYIVPLAQPEITSIEPDSAYWYSVASISDLAGTGFYAPAQVWLQKLGEPDIAASNVAVVTSTRITCDFDLTAADSGYWDVVVENPDAQRDTLVGGFRVLALQKPVVTSVEPDSGYWYSDVHITDLAGNYFAGPAQVWLQRTGQTNIDATDVAVVSPTRITCDFDLAGADSGYWDVVVENVDEMKDTLLSGFRVVAQPPPEIVSIEPDAGMRDEGVAITNLAGNHFSSSTTVYLAKLGEARIYASHVVAVSPTEITCDLDLGGAAIGLWDVVVENFDGQGDTLYSGFEVVPGLWEDEVRLTTDMGESITSKPNARCIAVDSDDKLHIVWFDDRGSVEQIYYKTFDGVAWSEDLRISDSPEGAEYPAIAVDSNDHLHVVWADKRHGETEIYYKSYDGAWSAGTRLTDAGGYSSWPAIAAQGTELHVVWEDDRSGDWEIYYLHYDGAAWGSELRLTDAAGFSILPAIAVDGSEKVHVVWVDQLQNVNHRMFDGASWSGTTVIDGDSRAEGAPSICPGIANDIHVTWHGKPPGETTFEIYYRRFDGTSWGSVERLTYASGHSHNSSVAADVWGTVYVVWADERPGNNEIYFKLFEGAGWKPEARLTEAPYDSRHPSAAVDSEGKLHVIWRDARYGHDDIYYRMRNPGDLSGIDPEIVEASLPGTVRIVPNPVHSSTQISFHVGTASLAEVAIYDIAGRLVWRHGLVPGEPGQRHVAWDGRDSSGRPVANGVYFLRIQVGPKEQSGKIVVLR